MKKVISHFLSAILAIGLSSGQLAAQKILQQGHVVFESEQSDEQDLMSQLAISGISMEYVFDRNHIMFNMEMLMGMLGVRSIMDLEDKAEPILLMNMMGQKYQITDLSEEDMQNGQDPLFGVGGGKVEYDKKDRKEIAGYACYKAVLTNDEGMVLTYYITEKIAVPGADRGKGRTELKGFPLEIRMSGMEGMDMVLVAKSVKDEVPADAFRTPEGYKKVTMAELESEMGGMLPFGGN
ncbi:MAG: hypothetical protein RLY31_3239 [Bacteroidota bacterium]|jgi:hypothetical protein